VKRSPALIQVSRDHHQALDVAPPPATEPELTALGTVLAEA
jgi:hypothetical protein